MEFAESGVVRGVKYGDYFSLIGNLSQVRQLIPDSRAYRVSEGNSTMHFTTRNRRVKLGLGMNSKDSRLFYWIFGDDDSVVSKISSIITSSVNTDSRRN